MAGKSLYILKKRPLQPRSEVWLRNITVFVMLAFYITFFIVPIGMAFVGSFHEWNPMNGKYNLIGLDNYQALFKNDLFWSAALNTVIFCAVVVFFRALLGFTCAYAIYSKFVKGKNFFMTMYYMPVIAPLVAVTFVWKFMYEPKVGLINTLLGLSINWLKNKNTALLAVMIMTIWKDFGYAVVLYMAGLMGLSEDVLDGTMDLLSYIKSIGGRSIYITNNSSKSTSDYVEKFKRMGIDSIPEDFVTAGSYTIDYLLKNHKDNYFYVIATNSYFEELKKVGLHVTNTYDEAVDGVLTAFDTELTYKKCEDACHLLMTKKLAGANRIWLATNADLRCPVDFGMIPDCGSICNMIAATTDREPIYLGKPSSGMVEYSMKVTGFSKEETLVVGDRIYTDIACGENAGVETCLVFTGEAKEEDIKTSANRIDFAFPSVRELVDYLKK